MTEPTRPTFMAITSTGGYIGRWFWNNSGVHDVLDIVNELETLGLYDND